MKSAVLIANIIMIDFIIPIQTRTYPDTTTTQTTTTTEQTIQCTIPFCSKDEEVIFSSRYICGYCCPKKSKKPIFN